MIPAQMESDNYSYGERQVFEALKSLPDTYTVFHSLRWNRRVGRRIQYGEADFCVCHPQFGILVIEVKSGDIHDFEETTRNIMEKEPETDALFYSEDFLAIAGLHALHNTGIEVPRQVAVVGLNNSRYAEICNPSLTSIDNMLYDTSLIAVRNLLEVLRGGRVNHRMSIGAEVVERSST